MRRFIRSSSIFNGISWAFSGLFPGDLLEILCGFLEFFKNVLKTSLSFSRTVLEHLCDFPKQVSGFFFRRSSEVLPGCYWELPEALIKFSCGFNGALLTNFQGFFVVLLGLLRKSSTAFCVFSGDN